MFIKVQDKMVNLSLVTSIETAETTNALAGLFDNTKEIRVLSYDIIFNFSKKDFLVFPFFSKDKFDKMSKTLFSKLLQGSGSFEIADKSLNELSSEEMDNFRDYKF